MTHIKNFRFGLYPLGTATLLAVMLVIAPVSAQKPSSSTEGFLGNFGDWSAFKPKSAKGASCYIASVPKTEKGNYKRRGETYITITHFKDKKPSLNVVSITAGYTYKKGSSVQLIVDPDGANRRFRLFVDKDTAWARNAKTDIGIVKAMKAGRILIVRGTSSRGTKTEDAYSLSGVTAAYNAINKACNVKGV